MRELHTLVLRRALAIERGESHLAARLEVDRERVALWRTGKQPIPDTVFRRVVGIVLQDDVMRMAQDRRSTPRANDQRTNASLESPNSVSSSWNETGLT